MKPLLYIHIPKTAGTAISKHSIRYEHSTLNEVMNVSTNIHQFIKFTCVRNPWDRLVSSYHFLTQVNPTKDWLPKGYLEVHNYLKSISFEKMCHALEVNKELIDWIHLRPQINWFSNELEFDFVMRFEKLEEDFKKVCELAGRPPVKLQKMNTSRHRPYFMYYNSETRDIVANFYKEDIVRFGYNFNLPSQP